MTINIDLARAEMHHRLGDLRSRHHARQHVIRRRWARRPARSVVV